MFDFKGKCVLITGGSRGIGRATAVLFASHGADVAFTFRQDRIAADSLRREIARNGGHSTSYRCKVENEADCRATVRKTLDAFGRIDVLVNNAGIWTENPIGQMTMREWQNSVDVNLTGTFNFCNLAIPVMRTQKSGTIINISSTAGQRGEALHSPYAAAKGGVIAFTKSIAAEVIEYGIRVNCVAPGWVDTDMVSSVMMKPVQKRNIVRSIPRGKIASPDEIAGPVLFLASDYASHIVGEIINVNGGSVMCG